MDIFKIRQVKISFQPRGARQLKNYSSYLTLHVPLRLLLPRNAAKHDKKLTGS